MMMISLFRGCTVAWGGASAIKTRTEGGSTPTRIGFSLNGHFSGTGKTGSTSKAQPSTMGEIEWCHDSGRVWLVVAALAPARTQEIDLNPD